MKAWLMLKLRSECYGTRLVRNPLKLTQNTWFKQPVLCHKAMMIVAEHWMARVLSLIIDDFLGYNFSAALTFFLAFSFHLFGS